MCICVQEKLLQNVMEVDMLPKHLSYLLTLSGLSQHVANIFLNNIDALRERNVLPDKWTSSYLDFW